MPREEWMRVDREFGAETDVYINEEPSGDAVVSESYCIHLCKEDKRFIRIVRRNCRTKSNSSSRQP